MVVFSSGWIAVVPRKRYYTQERLTIDEKPEIAMHEGVIHLRLTLVRGGARTIFSMP
jgi:hypothetical protein